MSRRPNWSFWVRVVILAAFIIFIFYYSKINTEAKYRMEPVSGNPLKEPVVIRTTCYTAEEGSICSTGIPPRQGIIAATKAWENYMAYLYTFEYVDGVPVPKELIGQFEVRDTGAGIDLDNDGRGDSIRNGQSIDVFQPTLEDAYKFRDLYGDYTLLILVPAEG